MWKSENKSTRSISSFVFVRLNPSKEWEYQQILAKN